MFTNKKREITPLNDPADITASPNPAATFDTSKIYPTPAEPPALEPAVTDRATHIRGGATQQNEERKIKSTILLIGIFYIASPLLSLITFIVFQQLLVITTGHSVNLSDIGSQFLQLSLILLLPGIIPIALGVGIITRKNIARKIAVFLLEIGILGTLITAPFRIGDVHSLGVTYFPDFLPYVYVIAILGFCATLAIAIAMLGFLSRNSTKRYFS